MSLVTPQRRAESSARVILQSFMLFDIIHLQAAS
jgi:hypothetical protein